ncbi:hypothetical protein ACWEFJ_12730 [Actinosynnema sp. NPDC004786]
MDDGNEAGFEDRLAAACASLTASTGRALDVEAMLAEVKRAGIRRPAPGERTATVLGFPGGGVVTSATARAAAPPAGGRRT